MSIKQEVELIMEKLLTTEDIGRILGIKPVSASRLLNREGLGRKVGRRVYVTEKEFNEFLERRKKAPRK